MNRRLQRGFSLIELLVVIAIIGIMLAIAVPSFGSSVRASREKSVMQHLTQDFQWARGAAASTDASTLGVPGATGTPTLTVVVRSDCSWTTAVNGTTDNNHSMTTAAVTSTAPGISCTGVGMTLPATFTFTSQGFVNTTGTLQFNTQAYSAQPAQFQILYSGAMFRVYQNNVSS